MQGGRPRRPLARRLCAVANLVALGEALGARGEARDRPEAGALDSWLGYAARRSVPVPDGETYVAPVDFLDEKRHEIAARLQELKPLVDEYRRLDAAAAALDGVFAAPVMVATAPTRRARMAPATRTRGAVGGGRRGRPKGSGTRAAEALALVKESPGITIPEIAEKMAIKQNYLYRVLPGLAEDGLVVKDGRGWRPTDAA